MVATIRPDPTYPHCQDITLTWGDAFTFGVTSMNFVTSAAAEVDMTSMLSVVYVDPNNSKHKIVLKDYDYGAKEAGELSIEFFGPAPDHTFVGLRNLVTVTGSATTPIKSFNAFLTQSATQIVAGELVKGTCTFKLTGTV